MNTLIHLTTQLQQIRQNLRKSRTGMHRSPLKRRAGFGLNEFIGISAALMIAALVVVPGIRNFSEVMLDDMAMWWVDVSQGIFATT